MADLIRQAFNASGMSMKRLADLSGTRYASVHGFFATGQRDPQLSTIQAWCKVLGLGLRLETRKRK